MSLKTTQKQLISTEITRMYTTTNTKNDYLKVTFQSQQ